MFSKGKRRPLIWVTYLVVVVVVLTVIFLSVGSARYERVELLAQSSVFARRNSARARARFSVSTQARERAVERAHSVAATPNTRVVVAAHTRRGDVKKLPAFH